MDLLKRTTNIVNRTRQVAMVMARYGFGHIVERVGFGRFVGLRAPAERLTDSAEATADAERVRMALEELGPTYVKLGQMLSARADLIPPEFIAELRKLQDDVPPFAGQTAREIVESELGAPLDELFAEFGEEPVASASIGQVHYARLPSGEEVAVKVQRPGIEEVIETDLTVLRQVAQVLERRIEWCHRAGLSQVMDEFAANIRGELVYTNEGHNADRFRANQGQDGIHIPLIYWSLTTNRVLTMELLRGRKISEQVAESLSPEERRAAAERLGHSLLQQVFVDGFFHGDPHPGNVLIMPDGRLALLDFGSVGWLGRESRGELLRLLMGILHEDAGVVCDQMLLLGALRDESKTPDLRREVDRLLGKFNLVDRAELRIGEVLEKLMQLMFRYEIRTPSEFALLMKTIIVLEGVCRQLDPQFDFRQVAGAFARRITVQQALPARLADDLLQGLREAHRHLSAIPRQLSLLLGRAESGRLKLRVEYDQIERPMHGLSAIGDRISFSIVLSALLIASALIVQGAGKPTMWSLPALGVLGFIISAIVGFWLLVLIIRSGRM
jgi:ubiquinone biosynthesis protein